MKIFVGADHRGFELKSKLVEYLRGRGYEVSDDGDDKLDPNDDYPQFASRVVTSVLAGQADDRGILLCGSGQGMCMAANRFKGIRAALGYDLQSARISRNDDDSNMLCLPVDLLTNGKANRILDTWLSTPFSGATRYVRRNKELDELG